jgi:RNA polymerase sigma factor (sigma-70 family)
MLSFEDKVEEIDSLLLKNKDKWRLDAISWLDYDDVCQIIRIHIHSKWHLWDQKRPFGPWCRRVISNQISNLIRNNYGTFAKPCLKCPHYVSETGCSFTSSNLQDESCDIYKKWSKKKKKMYNVKVPLSMESVNIKNSTDLYDELDFEKSAEKLHFLILSQLNGERYKRVYQMLYIEGMSENDVAKKMGFKEESGNRRIPRYKQIDNIKIKFLEIAKRILEQNDIIE